MQRLLQRRKQPIAGLTAGERQRDVSKGVLQLPRACAFGGPKRTYQLLRPFRMIERVDHRPPHRNRRTAWYVRRPFSDPMWSGGNRGT